MRQLVIWEMFLADKNKWIYQKDDKMTPLDWLYYSLRYDRLKLYGKE